MEIFLLICATIAMIVVTATYFLVPAKIIAHKSEYIKFFLVFLSAYLVLCSTIHIVTFNKLQLEEVSAFLALCFFPLLFLAYRLYKFKTVNKNQHVGFFLFWAAICTLPFALGLLYLFIVN